MLKASVVAVCAALITLTGPADACGWKRDGMGWRSAGVGYGYRDGWGYRSYRPWVGAGRHDPARSPDAAGASSAPGGGISASIALTSGSYSLQLNQLSDSL